MKVLDMGCGPGHVSLLAASLMGEEGSVLGVDTLHRPAQCCLLQGNLVPGLQA
jgi:23S rRNA U2552 (ribose-2'-O)-methylase RlmE/FtsJ